MVQPNLDSHKVHFHKKILRNSVEAEIYMLMDKIFRFANEILETEVKGDKFAVQNDRHIF